MYAVNGEQLASMLLAGTKALEEHEQEINDLNVFPVPDGDTGINMVLTAHSMVNALAALDLSQEQTTVEQVAAVAAEASLLGARGNSGVIFSQFVRGLSRGLKGRTGATPTDLARAFQYGLVYAYQAVSHPKEGTILTVAREAAKSARKILRENQGMQQLLSQVIAGGSEALAKTPDQLPVLKQAGVVDAGGYGLLIFLQGFLHGLTAETLPLQQFVSLPKNVEAGAVPFDFDFTYNYCTELMVRGAGLKPESLRPGLEQLGDSLILVEGTDMIKVHIHTNHPGQVLETCMMLGSLHAIKVDNMAEQHSESAWVSKPGLLVIAVSPGEGLSRIFENLGADRIVPGGETMNPSVEQFLRFMQTPTPILVLPNSNNIRLAAEQAAALSGNEVGVVPTADPQQGLAALLALDREAGLQDNLANMTEAVKSVRTARITYAARDSVWQDKPIAAGSILGFADGKLLSAGQDITAVIIRVVNHFEEEMGKAELLTLFEGAGLGEEQSAQILRRLTEAFPGLEIELKAGGQPNDYFLLMLE